MGVFEPAGFLRDAAIAAARELGVFEALARERARRCDELARELGVAGGHRLRALLDVLAALGAIARRGGGFAAAGGGEPPAAGAAGGVARAGWGLLADVIRRDRPLPDRAGRRGALSPPPARGGRRGGARAGGAARRRAAARRRGSLLDIGGGAGAYTAAFLDAHPDARATLVDAEATVALAAAHLARFGARVRFVAGDARTARLGEGHGAALLANVLHLHGPEACAELCRAAARAVAPGGLVVVKDLRVDEGRDGPLEGLLFALNMAVYTGGGDVYETSRHPRLARAGGARRRRGRTLAAAPEMVVVIGRRPRAEADAGTAAARTWRASGASSTRRSRAAGAAAWRELERDGALLDEARAAGPPRLGPPGAAAARAGRRDRRRARGRGREGGEAAAAGRGAAPALHRADAAGARRAAGGPRGAGGRRSSTTGSTGRACRGSPPRSTGSSRCSTRPAPMPPRRLGAPSAAAFRARTPTLADPLRAHALRRRDAAALRHARRSRRTSARARTPPASISTVRSIATSPRRSSTSCVTSRRTAMRSRRCTSTSASPAGSACTSTPSSRTPRPARTTRSSPRRGWRRSGRRSRARSASAPWCARTPAPRGGPTRCRRRSSRRRRASAGTTGARGGRCTSCRTRSIRTRGSRLALAAGAGLPLGDQTLAGLARLPPAAFAALPDDPRLRPRDRRRRAARDVPR